MIDADMVWAPAVVTVAYLGQRVAFRWLDGRERATKAADERNEREAALASKLDAMGAKVDGLETQWKAFQVNNAGRR